MGILPEHSRRSCIEKTLGQDAQATKLPQAHPDGDDKVMPGMRRNSRTIHLIEASLHQFEIQSEIAPASPEIVLLARSVLDELRRLENKWRAQVAAGSSRRIDADFRTLQGWYKRWLAAARSISRTSNSPSLDPEIQKIASEIAQPDRWSV